MKSLKVIVLTGIVATLLSTTAQAHKRWLLPSNFSVSEYQWITVDASVSNNLFYPDRRWPLDGIKVFDPNGDEQGIENAIEGKRRSVFDVNLDKDGTYKIGVKGDMYFASYPNPDYKEGERENIRIRAWSLDDLAEKVPSNVENVDYARAINRLETYVTVGAPTKDVFKLEKSGLEYVPVTHPNDLYQGEKGEFQFMVDGEPTEGVEVVIVWDGTRYRDQENELTVTTDAEGKVLVDLEQAGRFLIEASYNKVTPDEPKFKKTYLGYLATFEVLPL